MCARERALAAHGKQDTDSSAACGEGAERSPAQPEQEEACSPYIFLHRLDFEKDEWLKTHIFK